MITTESPSTTMRVMVGLTEPTSGEVRILGRRFGDLPNPGREVGVLCTRLGQSARLSTMSETASKWECRRVETTRRLRWCALELTRDQGFDGWTMDDLAESAEVSRRTVFNYFDNKVAVVLGAEHEVGPETLQTFLDGGPTGSLVGDIVVLAVAAIQEKGADLELAMLARSVVLKDPQLIGLVHERFEARTQMLVDHIIQREGAAFGAERARRLVRLLVTVFDDALCRIDPDEPRPFLKFLTDAIDDARALLTS